MEHYSNYNTLIYHVVLIEQMQSPPNNVVVQTNVKDKMMFFDLLGLLFGP